MKKKKKKKKEKQKKKKKKKKKMLDESNNDEESPPGDSGIAEPSELFQVLSILTFLRILLSISYLCEDLLWLKWDT